MYTTDMYEGIIAETVTLEGHNGDSINAYFARPMGSRPLPYRRSGAPYPWLG